MNTWFNNWFNNWFKNWFNNWFNNNSFKFPRISHKISPFFTCLFFPSDSLRAISRSGARPARLGVPADEAGGGSQIFHHESGGISQESWGYSWRWDIFGYLIYNINIYIYIILGLLDMKIRYEFMMFHYL